ncbi:MAG: tetratricopeptide repeat protein, partial [Caldilineaceae bacterium]|nr:tetratricopeptide repeat protein [Caldilineaceae bacterium]
MASATELQSHHHPFHRRPLRMLALAALILLLAVASRWLMDRARPAASTPAPAPIERSSEDAITRLQAKIRANPDDPHAYAGLGLGLLQQVRESNDMSLYARAGEAFDAALQRDPLQVDALMGQGVLALALHDFTGAIEWAEQARALNPFRAGILGILVDAQVELGQYEDAVSTLQAMVDLRPDLQSYSRVSYLRELHGDMDGAIDAMQTAVTSAAPGTEDWRWTLTHLGHLYFNRGDLDAAAAIYQEVLAQQANYPYAQDGMARVTAAKGDTATAIAMYSTLTSHLPLPSFVIALGELYEATGKQRAAQEQYELVVVMQQLNAASGMNVDLEMASFNAAHSEDPAQVLAEARTAYAERPTVYGADTLAWALYRNGDYSEAWQYSQEAL